jgi:1-deoxy-D-xylulose-5-phosphate synthase
LEADRPCVVHCKTVKGKGFVPAEDGGLEGMEKWHAAKPASIVDGMPAPKKVVKAPAGPPAPPQYTTVFGNALVDQCERDPRVCGITAAMNSGTGLNILQAAMPDRYYDVGIAEQHAVLMAAGMALQGMKPVAAIYSTFLQRGFDQIVHDVALQNLDVVFAMDRAGLVGDDGPTHHGVFDISYMRPLPNMTLMAPRDESMLVDMLHTAVEIDGPVGLRYPRGEAEGVPLPTKPRLVEIGKGEVLREGGRVALLGYGYGVPLALGAADLLEQHGLDVTVADARFAKPLDADLIRSLVAEHELLVTIEENQLAGGFGSAVVELLADEDLLGDCRVMRVGIPDRFITHGKPALLRAEVGLTPEAIADRVTQSLGDRTATLV